MADLSAVLRKTIDGLPRATPQLRAKVYDKARAAITRQIEAADPPLADDVVEARMSALDDAIERTEAHYLRMEREDVPPDAPEPAEDEYADQSPERADLAAAAPPAARYSSYDQDAATAGKAQRSAAPVFPAESAMPDRDAGPATVAAPFVLPGSAEADAHREDDEPYPEADADNDDPRRDHGIPEADVSGPRYAPPRKGGGIATRSVLTGFAVVLLLGGAAAVGWTYRDEIEGLLISPAGLGAPVATRSENAEAGIATPQPPPETPAVATPATGTDTPAAPNPPTETAAVAPPPDAGSDAAPAATPNANSSRQFTQRLLPDGTEVDEGPGAGSPNAFNEGTDVAAASPLVPEAMSPSVSTTVTSEIGKDIAPVAPDNQPAEPAPDAASAEPAAPDAASAEPAAPDGAAAPAATELAAAVDTPLAGAAPSSEAASAEADTQTAALQPGQVDGVVPVAQKAVFYEERSETEAGTQQSGNVVWSVVSEPPAEGRPAEPAIRAVADVPEENLKMTMTIRRNSDPTLPASHVIELLFEVPQNFDGGGVANVQRLALKPTEQARGEPLIGVAGKMAEGFFVIALNNLDQAVQSNLSLLSKEDWIDIPLAYSTGRRALMSIEKGIPGERVFKEAMDAWSKKT